MQQHKVASEEYQLQCFYKRSFITNGVKRNYKDGDENKHKPTQEGAITTTGASKTNNQHFRPNTLNACEYHQGCIVSESLQRHR